MTRSDAGKLGWIASRHAQERQHDAFIAAYNEHPKCCLYCEQPLPYEKRYNKFCDSSCAAIYNNQKRAKRTNTIKEPKRNRKPKICAFCGKELDPDGRYNRKFCSYECSEFYAKNEREKKLLTQFVAVDAAGEFPSSYQQEADRRLVRKYLEHKYGHKCSICGITEWMGKPVPIVVDHIDGNALNRKLDNFRLVCANCDAQLPTYKSKNKHGRQWRRKYETTFRGTE